MYMFQTIRVFGPYAYGPYRMRIFSKYLFIRSDRTRTVCLVLRDYRGFKNIRKTDSARFRQYVKEKKFTLINCHEFGMENELCIPANEVRILSFKFVLHKLCFYQLYQDGFTYRWTDRFTDTNCDWRTDWDWQCLRGFDGRLKLLTD
jgi:hypothetical protein